VPALLLLLTVVLLVLVWRFTSTRRPSSGSGGRPRFVAPDDDPDFLRELDLRTRRDEDQP
jgi:hypothetical protein